MEIMQMKTAIRLAKSAAALIVAFIIALIALAALANPSFAEDPSDPGVATYSLEMSEECAASAEGTASFQSCIIAQSKPGLTAVGLNGGG